MHQNRSEEPNGAEALALENKGNSARPQRTGNTSQHRLLGEFVNAKQMPSPPSSAKSARPLLVPSACSPHAVWRRRREPRETLGSCFIAVPCFNVAGSAENFGWGKKKRGGGKRDSLLGPRGAGKGGKNLNDFSGPFQHRNT